MNSIRISLLIFCIVAHGRAEDKKTKQRDVNDAAETVDYALNKIPLYVIPNTSPVQEAKVPVAVIPGVYQPTYFNAGIKEAKQFKYGFYAPYKSSKATPIHEPTSEEPPVAYGSHHVYQKPEYDAAYKVAVAAKDYQTNNNQQYVKYETAKSALPKHQSIPNSNAYASVAPAAYGYSAADSSLSSYVPPPRKFITYDPEKKVHVQYVIKYVPVPYTVQSHDQHYAQSPADVSYATPQTSTHNKEAHKKTVFPHSQFLHSLNPVTYPATTEAHYADNPKYAEAYAPAYDDAAQQAVYKSYSQPAYYAKYADKNAKKYVPTSYVLATLGKSAPTHYSASIKHENSGHEQLYSPKLQPAASLPLASIDKYSGQDYKSADESKSYSEPDYAYAVAGDRYKHGAVLPPPSHFLAYDYNVPEQYQQHQQLLYFKKDVSASVSSTPSYEGTSAKA